MDATSMIPGLAGLTPLFTLGLVLVLVLLQAGSVEAIIEEIPSGVIGSITETRASTTSTGRASVVASATFSGYDVGRNDTAKKFYVVGNTWVSGIHAAVTHLKTVVFIDRTDSNNTIRKLPNGKWAYGTEYKLDFTLPEEKRQRVLDVKSNVFCSTGQFLRDGTLLSIGGSSDAFLGIGDPLYDGAQSIRSFKPCYDGTCDFQLLGNMTSKRWYGTSQRLPDGRIFIIGGANVFGNIAINDGDKNNPTYEYWPRAPGEGNYYLQFLDDTLPYNLYPFLHIMPSGLLFIFAGVDSILLNHTTNQVVKELPSMDFYPNIFRLYPVSGSTALLPLTSANNYTAEVLICGGNSNNGVNNVQNAALSATDTCGRITPEASAPVWEYDTMPFRRVMPDMLHLVDGSILVVNGAAKGFQGLRQAYASGPVLTPVIYDPWKPLGKRWFKVSDSSQVARVYHSSALILPDASVLISGSNPNPYITKTGPFPTEFRIEKFLPPYLFSYTVPRPVLTKVPKSITLGSTFAIYFNASASTTDPMTRFQACVLEPGFSTHNLRHGMRYVVLDFVAISVRTTNQAGILNNFVAALKAPPNGNLAPAGIYWLHILDRGVPNKEGIYVNVVNSNRRKSF